MNSRPAILVIVALLSSSIGGAAEAPSLTALLPPEALAKNLIPRESWRPFPAIDDRAFWARLPETARGELIAQGEAHRGAPWPPIPATAFLEFHRSGSRQPYQSLRFERRDRLGQLVLAECVENHGRFIDDIINGIWAIAEESFWGESASTWTQASLEEQQRFSYQQLHRIRTPLPEVTKAGVDLWVAETAGLFALTHYLLGERLDRVTPVIRARIQTEVERRMLGPCRDRDFKWMFEHGNWNVWIASNWLTAVLLLETDQAQRIAAVQKITAQMDHFLVGQLPDGACHEGPGYWRWAAGTLFDSLELLQSATDGAVDLYKHPLIRHLAAYIYRVHLAGKYFFNYGDGAGAIDMPTELMMRFGRRIHDPHLVALGAALPGGDALNGSTRLLRRLPALQDLATGGPKTQAQPPLLRDTWLPAMQVMTARTKAGTTDGLMIAAKAGSNGEGHNHNDAGSFLVFSDGQPVFIDVGPEAYTAKNSGPDRYDIWTMQSAWHNLPTIGGVMQQAGRAFAAREVSYTADDSAAQLAMELAGTFPPEARLRSWRRIVRLERGGPVAVTEQYELSNDVADIALTLMTPGIVHSIGKGGLRVDVGGEARPVQVRFNAKKLRAVIEPVPLRDEGLRRVWGEQLMRIRLVAEQPSRQDEWKITFSQIASSE